MNILITGGLGFVGSHLANFLSKQNHTIFVLDNLFTGDVSNLEKYGDTINENCHFYFGETKDICMIFKDLKIDLIYHLGEYSRVEQSFEDIDIVFDYNWKSIYEVLKFTRQQNAKLIYCGSSTKFGDKGQTKFSSPYAYTKTANTELVKTYCEWFNLKYAITYFYNVYGKGEIDTGKYATVIGKFIKAKKSNEKVVITKPGTQQRNFTYIDDVINALELIGRKGLGDDFGIGNDIEYDILSIAKMLDLEYELGDEKKGNRMKADVISDKTKALGWEAKIQLKDYLKSI